MASKEKIVKEPLFHIVKREKMPILESIGIRIGSVLVAILLCCLICGASAKENPFMMVSSLFDGAFGTDRRIWLLLQDTALLLGVALAIVPAFRMKFWNLGANGQILMGCLATTYCMYTFGGKLPDGVVILFMIISSILAGAIWAVIPAIFKAFFKTNESLFTLMMNYIAAGLVSYFIGKCKTNGSGVLNPIDYANLPEIGNKYLLPIICALIMFVCVFIYLRYSKHGYEISVVGESENTAKYIGINVKKVVIRTLILSGALSGIIGLLLSGGINHTVNTDMANNMGFTAIMVAWLAKLNPIYMIIVSFFITFLSKGMGQVRKDFGFTNSALTNVVIGIIYFFLIASEFFITYKIVFKSKKKKEGSNKIEDNIENLNSTPENAEKIQEKEEEK